MFQTVVTEINHAIGAEGLISSECKEIVSQYGNLIWDLLVSGVGFLFLYFFLFINISLQYLYQELDMKLYSIHGLQVAPDKICSEIGVCVFGRDKHERSKSFHNLVICLIPVISIHFINFLSLVSESPNCDLFILPSRTLFIEDHHL